MAKAEFVKAARKAVPEHGIAVGDSYYWWKFRFGGKRYSKTPPKRSQLTQSSFYSQIYNLEDDVIANATADDSLEGVRDDVVAALEDLKSECEDSLENIPDNLREGASGQLLQERIDALDTAISEFEELDFSDSPDESNADESDSAYESREIAKQDYWDDKLEELQGISIDAP